MNRRDILKLFGVGAAAVPIVGGVVRREAEVVLVEEPKIEVARKLPSSTDGDMMKAFLNRDQLEMRVDFYNKLTGEHFQFESETYLTSCEFTGGYDSVEVIRSGGALREFRTQGTQVRRWNIKGVCTGAVRV